MELKKYLEILLKRKKVLLAILILIPLFAAIFAKMISPIYGSTAKIWIRQNSQITRFVSNVSTDFGKFEYTDSDSAMPTMEEILESNQVLGKVISDLGLKNRKGVLFNKDDFLDIGVMSLIRGKRGISIENISDSNVFKIVGYSSDPLEAKEIASKELQIFKEVYADLYKKIAGDAIQVIKKRLEEMDSNLKEAEKKLNDYKINKNFYSKDQLSTLVEELSDLEAEVKKIDKTLTVNRASLKTVNKSLEVQPEFKESSKNMESNPVIKQAKLDLSELYVNLKKIETDKTPEHPDVKQILAQIESTKQIIKDEIESTLSSVTIQRNSYYDSLITKYGDTEISIASGEIERQVLRKQIKDKNKKIADMTRAQEGYNSLSREFDSLEKTRATLRTDLENALNAASLDAAPFTVIQLPEISSNLKDNLYFPPSAKKAFVISAILSIFFGICFVFLLEYLDETVQGPDDAQSILNQRLTGIIPVAKREVIENIHYLQQSFPLSDSIQNLAKSLVLTGGWREEKKTNIVAVISPSNGDGKSTVASSLGASFALNGKKVLIVDGDSRKPGLHSFFGVDGSKGLAEYLKGAVSFESATVSTSIESLSVLPAGSDSRALQQVVFSRDRFREVLRSASYDRYDVVIIDTTSFDEGPEALAFAGAADGVLSIIVESGTGKAKAKAFIDTLIAAGFRIDGIVLNKHRDISISNWS